jgi:hypothetical protein
LRFVAAVVATLGSFAGALFVTPVWLVTVWAGA